MRKWPFTLVFIALFYLVGTYGLGISVYPPSITSDEQRKNEYTKPDHQGSFLSTFERGALTEVDLVHTYHDEVIAIATIFIAIYTVVLGIATQALVEEGRRSNKKQLRAYIGIVKIRFVLPHLRNDSFGVPDIIPPNFVFEDYIVVEIMNFGSSPASDVKIMVNWQPTIVGARLDESNFEFGDLGDEGESTYYITPGNTQHAVIPFRKTENIKMIRVCPESFPYGNIALCRFSPTSRSRRDLKETAGFR
jgi:hypothetical protein